MSTEKRATRIYEVTATKDGVEETFLIEATSQAAAWRYVAGKFVPRVTLPNGKRIAEQMAAGKRVIPAKPEPSDPSEPA